MTNVTEQEAVNQFGFIMNDEMPNVNQLKINLPSSAGENGVVFGAASPTWFFGNITGDGLPENTVLTTGQGLQLVPDKDGNISEQRVCFDTLECFYENGNVTFDGFEYAGSNA